MRRPADFPSEALGPVEPRVTTTARLDRAKGLLFFPRDPLVVVVQRRTGSGRRAERPPRAQQGLGAVQNAPRAVGDAGEGAGTDGEGSLPGRVQ